MHCFSSSRKISQAKLEWPSGIQYHACCMQHGQSLVQAPNLYQCLQMHLQVCGSKRLSCHANLYIVNRCHTRSESEAHTSEKVCKRIHSSFETQGRHHQKSKTWVSVAHTKDLCPPKIPNSRLVGVIYIALHFLRVWWLLPGDCSLYPASSLWWHQLCQIEWDRKCLPHSTLWQ